MERWDPASAALLRRFHVVAKRVSTSWLYTSGQATFSLCASVFCLYEYHISTHPTGHCEN